MRKLLFLIPLLFLAACEKEIMEADAMGANASIVGTWVDNGYEEDVTMFERSEALDASKYGFILSSDGSFVERKNAGWCGTPPITYDDYEGTWEALSDSLLEVTVGYWGGVMTYQMRIITLESDQLKIRYLYADERDQVK